MDKDEFQKYRSRRGNEVVAVQLDLDTEGFTYTKWGGAQRCKPRDWLVNNQGETYTVDAETFANTYENVSPGLYRKKAKVWAKQATEAGSVTTKEGSTDYERGDYVVYNDGDESDRYAISAGKFSQLYEPVDE